MLLHPTSLPGPHGSGDLGEEAHRSLDFLHRAGHRYWQMHLVFAPGDEASPYSALSAFAGNPALISLTALVNEGLLAASDLAAETAAFVEGTPVDFPTVNAFRDAQLRRAFAAFRDRELSGAREGRTDRGLPASSGDELGRRRPPNSKGLARSGYASANGRHYEAFTQHASDWLDDFALYGALKRAHGGAPWFQWDKPVRLRDAGAIEDAARQLADEIEYIKFTQFVFDLQWRRLRTYAASRGVGFIGDMPIFVAHDSADVWQHPDSFRLDAEGQPTVVAGVPPDYFTKTGQRWGNPLYRWKRLKRRGYDFWVRRLRTTLERFDIVRVDHFIGFQRYWEVPGHEPTAEHGRWMKGPGIDLFHALRRELGDLPLIAEDLGEITKAVKKLRDDLEIPGLRVLQYAFGNDPSAEDFKPHNYPRRCVAYTGTHDNDTTVGWFYETGHSGGQSTRTAEQAQSERENASAYLGRSYGHAPDPAGPLGSGIHWDLIRAALMSVADTAIVPMQDCLGLGSRDRMNRPGTGAGAGNWAFRLHPRQVSGEIADQLFAMTATYGRWCKSDRRARPDQPASLHSRDKAVKNVNPTVTHDGNPPSQKTNHQESER